MYPKLSHNSLIYFNSLQFLFEDLPLRKKLDCWEIREEVPPWPNLEGKLRPFGLI